MPGVVVEAMVNGQEQRYGAEAEDSANVGECDYEGNIGGGRGGGEMGVGGGGFGVVGAPAGGEGPAAPEGDVSWAAAVVLGAGGLGLVGAARLMRKRSRR
jgi:hypothetical protein